MPVRAPRIIPGDVPAEAAGRRLGLTEAEFKSALPGLLARGFPGADPTTGLYDLEAVDAWRRARHPHLFTLTGATTAVDARTGIVRHRLGASKGHG